MYALNMSGLHFFIIFKSNLSSFAFWKTSSFVILCPISTIKNHIIRYCVSNIHHKKPHHSLFYVSNIHHKKYWKTKRVRPNDVFKTKQFPLYGVQLQPQANIFYKLLFIRSCASGNIGLFFIPQHESKVCSVRRMGRGGITPFISISVLNGGGFSYSCILRLPAEQGAKILTN